MSIFLPLPLGPRILLASLKIKKSCFFPGGGGGGGGSLIFLYIRRLGPFFWVQNFEFHYFLGFSEN